MATFIPIQLSHAALLAACITLVYIYTRRRLALARLAAQHHCQPIPRLPSIDPLLNLDILFSALRSIARHTLLRDQSLLFQRHGQTLALRELHHRIVFTTEPENIKTVLSLRFSDYGVGFRLPAFAPLLGAGIFDTDGEHWSASRALVRPAFTREQVADLTAFEELFQDLVNVLPQDGGTVDLQALFFKYTMDSATEFLFGQSAGTLRTEEGGKFARAFQDAQRAIIARGTLGWMSVFYWDRRAEQGNRVCREFAGRFVDEAFRAVREKKREVEMQEEKTQDGEGEKKQKYIFAHELASRTEDRQRVVDESMNVLLAGRDTTASLLSNLFFMLAKNPDIWTKLRREVSSLEGRPPTYEELRSLDYVQCCLHESLRLHPVVPRNQRLALRDTVLPLGGGPSGHSPILIRKGTLVAYSVHAMHRRQDIYGADAEEFRPERWRDAGLRPRWGYLPFNGGPRVCLGQRYALTEAGYVLVRMAQRFARLESRDGGEWEESLALTLCSRNGVKVGLVPGEA